MSKNRQSKTFRSRMAGILGISPTQISEDDAKKARRAFSLHRDEVKIAPPDFMKPE
jgi:hypothetical protein